MGTAAQAHAPVQNRGVQRGRDYSFKEEAAVASYATLLRQCGDSKALLQGRQVHVQISKAGLDQHTYLGNCLVQMYGKCGSIEDAARAFGNIAQKNVFSWTILVAAYAHNGYLQDARVAFDKMPRKNVVSWNVMISAYAQQGFGKNALDMLKLMDLEGIRADEITFVSLVDACGELKALAKGKAIHARIVVRGFQSHLVLGNSLVSMYGKSGSMEDARSAFEKLPQPDVVSWNAMVSAYARNGYLQEARRFFDNMPLRDVMSWNAMITAFAQRGHHREALVVLGKMDLEGMQPDQITFVSSLDACAGLPALAEGKLIHASIRHHGLESVIQVATSLINMYGKCGSTQNARMVFDKMTQSDAVSWNSMLLAYARNGYLQEALKLLEQMDLEGMKPSEVTHVNILSAFSHAGMLEDGCSYFVRINRDYGLAPMLEHYACIIDLLGRVGELDEAEELIKQMPIQADIVAWTSLLGACKLQNDPQRAVQVAEEIQDLDSETLVLLSNFSVRDSSTTEASSKSIYSQSLDT